MPHRSRLRLRRRLRSLAALELLNIPLQAWIWFGVIGFPATGANLTGFGLVALLLVQGAGYWWAKLRQLRERWALPPGLGFFAFARSVNPPVLGAGLAFAAWSAANEPGAGSLPGLGFALFAVLEHVNYYRTQLMYDTAADLRRLLTRGLRKASLARDLARAAR